MGTQRTILSFDFGTKSIGCAIGQEITRTARPLTAFKAQDGVPRWEAIQATIRDWQPDLLIVGLPLNIDGTEQPLTQRVKKFAKQLQTRFQLPVELQDERLSTVEAKAALFASKGYRGLAKTAVDNQSAAIILESWFTANG